MFRHVILRGILGRKARLFITSIAVILGTAFLSGTTVFSATLNRTFDNLFQDVFRNVDAYVRSNEVVEGEFGREERTRIPLTLTDIVRDVPGVADVAPDIQAFARILAQDGTPLGSGGGPATFGSIGTEFQGSLWRVVQGRFANGPGEVVLDEASATKGGYDLGDMVRVVAQSGSREFELVGVASYGNVRSPGGATFALFDPETGAAFLGKTGFVDALLVVGDGSRSDTELAAAIDAALSPGANVETLTGAEITKATQDAIGQALAFFGTILSVFSYIALGVGSFVIYNVFSISAAQRQRENALLRAIGASRRQISRAMLAESAVVGVIGSAFGVLGGIGLSVALTALLNGLGIDVPSTGVVVPVSAIVNTMFVGLVVTLCSAWLPARRSGKIPPLAAMRATAIEVPQVGRTRTRVGIGVLLLGLGVVAGVIFGAPTAFLGLGIVFVFGGTIVLGPVIAPGVGKLIGLPVARFRGVAGVMARQNSVRNPKRAARTASPVLIGVALVTAVSALAASIRGQVDDIFTEQFKGDYAVSVESRGFGGLSPALAVELNEIDGVDRATGIGVMLAEIDGTGRSLTVITPATIEGNYDIGLIGAQYSDLGADGIFLSQDWSVQQDKPVGSTITLTLADSTERTLQVRGLYRNAELVGSRVVSRSLLEGANVQSFDLGVYVKLAAGADDGEVRARLQQAVTAYGQGKLLSKQEYIDEQAGSVNQLLGLIYGLLLLSVIISIVGIVITMLLSVYERQREIGLLRAVGMTKRQVRTTVRWESVITALFGAVTGIALGIGLGWAVVFSLRDQGLTSFDVPIGTTVFIMCMSFFVGVFAAVYPAWRATRTPVLDALVTT